LFDISLSELLMMKIIVYML